MMRPSGPMPRWLRWCALGVGLFALAMVPVALREAGRPMIVGGLDLGGATGYVWALAWACVLAVVLLVLPLRRLDKQTLLVLWGAKVAVALGFMLAYEARYRSGLDAFWYYYHGVPNHVALPLELGGGVNNVYTLVWALHSIVPDAYHAMKVTFAFFGLAAIYLLYRAARLVWPSLGPGVLAFVGLFPSVLFFSSILGKDPLVLLGIAAAAMGLALLWRARWVGLPWLAAGLAVVQLVRPWIGPILVVPAIFLALAGRFPAPSAEARAKGLGLALTVLAVGTALAALALSNTPAMQTALQEIDETSRAWAEGGTGQTPPEFTEVWVVLAFLPWGMFTALFRPLPGDGGGWFGALAAFEGIVLLCLVLLVAFNLSVRGTGKRLAQPPAQWVLLTVLLWSAAYAFVSYQNLGTGFRFRLQVVPILLFALAGLAQAIPRSTAPTSRLRVLALSPTYRPLVGGAETALHELFVRLAAAGHEVDVVTPRHAGPAQETVAPGLRIFREGRSVRSRPAKFLLYQWWALRRVARLHDERPYDVALLAYGIHASLIQPWLQHRLGLPVVIEEIHLGTGAEISTAAHNPPFVGPLLRASYRKAQAVVAQSRDTGRFIESTSGRTDWRLIPQGTDPEVFHPRNRSEAVRGRFGSPRHLLVTASRLSTRKNLGDMLQAFTRLPPGLDARLVIAGDGPERLRLQQAAADLGIADRVDFTGFLPEPELAALLASADVFLSTATYEAFGLSIVDAMSSGIPVVAYDAGGPNDFLRDGESGHVVAHEPGLLAQAVRRLLEDPAERKGMGRQARQVIEGGYTWQANADRHAELLQAVVDRRRAP